MSLSICSTSTGHSHASFLYDFSIVIFMIQNSFLFLDRVGKGIEQNLHDQGIRTWDDFLKKDSIKGIADHKKPYFDRMIAKAKRTITSVLPVSKNRKGACVNCGACCKLPYKCPFSKYEPDGRCHCRIYSLRPLNCRKYPRTKSECITAETCGFRFE